MAKILNYIKTNYEWKKMNNTKNNTKNRKLE